MTVFATENKKISKLPKLFTVIVTVVEVILIVLLSYVASLLIKNMVSETAQISTHIDATSQAATRSVNNNFSNLSSVDAFFGGIQNQNTAAAVIAPESSLDLKIFGLRTSGNGKGTAILKPHGEAQRLYQVGENVTDAVRLTSVYHDRIEIRRNGITETIYLDKERSQKTFTDQSSMQSVSQEKINKIDEIITALDLNPFRKNNRISGFVIGQEATSILLSQSGLKAGDILYEANGEELISWERLNEVSENTNEDGLTIKFERHGELQTITLSNLILGL